MITEDHWMLLSHLLQYCITRYWMLLSHLVQVSYDTDGSSERFIGFLSIALGTWHPYQTRWMRPEVTWSTAAHRSVLLLYVADESKSINDSQDGLLWNCTLMHHEPHDQNRSSFTTYPEEPLSTFWMPIQQSWRNTWELLESRTQLAIWAVWSICGPWLPMNFSCPAVIAWICRRQERWRVYIRHGQLGPQGHAHHYEASKKRQGGEAQELNKPLELPCKYLFCESNPIPTKCADTCMGLISSAYCCLHHGMFWTLWRRPSKKRGSSREKENAL